VRPANLTARGPREFSSKCGEPGNPHPWGSSLRSPRGDPIPPPAAPSPTALLWRRGGGHFSEGCFSQANRILTYVKRQVAREAIIRCMVFFSGFANIKIAKAPTSELSGFLCLATASGGAMLRSTPKVGHGHLPSGQGCLNANQPAVF
jgi:hypothetical protein